MKKIEFPDNFPSREEMLSVLKKTIEKSWKIDLDSGDIENWLQNFSGRVYHAEDEKRIALWLLCNFTFYNVDEVNYLCRTLFNRLVHQMLIDDGLGTEEDAEICIQNTAFTSIGDPGESGGMLLYHFRQESNLDLDRFIFPTQINSTACQKIVCIDDVMISGGTARRFIYNHKSEFSNKKVYYIALITTDTAVKKMQEQGITVIYCIKLDDRSRLFTKQSLTFFKFPNLSACAKEIAEEYGRIIEPQKPLGYKNGQYSFGLYYNIPNNSLPIFWSVKRWQPIFLRKEKYHNAKEAQRKYSFYI